MFGSFWKFVGGRKQIINVKKFNGLLNVSIFEGVFCLMK
jgi:hypothetical protein